MKAGFSEFDFTPVDGFMPGEGIPYFAFDKPKCPLLVNAAALENGETVILISVDAGQFLTPRATRLREQISTQTGVPVSHILLAATHIHTGASYYEPSSGAPGEPHVASYVDSCVVKTAVAAFEAMQEGYRIGTGKGVENRMSFNRDCILYDGRQVTIPGRGAKGQIVGYFGLVDYDVHVMRLDDPHGRPRAFFVNYANHPDNDNTARRSFSSDFPGFLRQNLKKQYGEELTVLFFNGACGDVNAYNYQSGCAEPYASPDTYMPEQMGRLLTETVDSINQNIVADQDSPVIKVRTGTNTYLRRVPSEKELGWALDIRAKFEENGRVTITNREIASIILSHDPNAPETVEMETGCLRIGDWTVVTVPGELYTDIGLSIKALAPNKKLVISELTNGTMGYIPPDHVFDSAFYGGKYYAGQLGRGTKDRLLQTIDSLLQALEH